MALRGRRELLDGLTVLAGAGLIAWLTLANPAIDDGMQPALAVVATAYLPLTIMLVTFTAELMLEGLSRNRGMWLVMAAVTTALCGTVVRALFQSEVIGSGWQGLSTGALVRGYRHDVGCDSSSGHAVDPGVSGVCPQRRAEGRP